MCGITGFIDKSWGPERGNLEKIAAKMALTLQHRGPDDSGEWSDNELGIAFGHRRLSIIDLSEHGHQPMRSRCDRYIISYNGEIYNFRELRSELEALGHSFHGGSDTEVMLAAFSQWGLDGALTRFNGMFAYSVWDRADRELHLVRDRLGEKPLYYGWAGGLFLFGSELKSLQAHPVFRAEISRDALAQYLRYNYVPAPLSIFKDVFKLPAGMKLVIPLEGFDAVRPCPEAYWSVKELATGGIAEPLAGNENEIIEQLDQLLREAVAMRMVSDVPLGAFLSGGLDSSTIVALMQAQSAQPVKTFTIGFNERAYNEAEYASSVAKHLGTDHTELYITPQQTMDVIPKLPGLYDEPFSDSSQIPTYLISELARRQVTVSLSGDGGDELFGGYNRYFFGNRVWNKIGWVPAPLRNLVSRAIWAVPPPAWERAFALAAPLLPRRYNISAPAEKFRKLAEVLRVHNPQSFYYGLISYWEEPWKVVVGSGDSVANNSTSCKWPNLPDFRQNMMCLDAVTYLPDDILVKVDRAAMGVSLETRVPFLDHRVVDFAWRIPLHMKFRGGAGKWILRQVLHKYVPRELVERPKMGFGVPIDSWLRGPLRDWAESLLNERRLKDEGMFNPEPIGEKWREHLSGRRDWQHHLWNILMFQAWNEKFQSQKGSISG